MWYLIVSIPDLCHPLYCSTVGRESDGKSGPEVIKLFSFTFQLSMKCQLLLKTNLLEITDFFAFKLSGVVIIMLINVKMPTIVGILTFMSMINFNLY